MDNGSAAWPMFAVHGSGYNCRVAGDAGKQDINTSVSASEAGQALISKDNIADLSETVHGKNVAGAVENPEKTDRK